MTSPVIRPIAPQDMNQLVELCALHASFEKAEYIKNGKSDKLNLALFKESPSLYCFVADVNGEIVGYSTVTKEFSTWDADYYLHMDCLFIMENSRSSGLGSLFMATIKKFAIDHCCTHVQWQTPIDNFSAIEFYKKMGAVSKDKKRFFLEL